MNKLVKLSFVAFVVVFSISSCSETTAQSTNTTQEVVKTSAMKMSIDGMSCAMGCAKAIETELKNVAGVSNAVVDFESAIASIEFNSNLVSEAGLVDFVNDYRNGSFNASALAAKKTCCASKSKSCSTDKKNSADAAVKSCSDEKKSELSTSN